jgi:hypothetical protein
MEWFSVVIYYASVLAVAISVAATAIVLFKNTRTGRLLLGLALVIAIGGGVKDWLKPPSLPTEREIAPPRPFPPPVPGRFTVAVARLSGDEGEHARDLVMATLHRVSPSDRDASATEDPIRLAEWDHYIDGGASVVQDDNDARANAMAQQTLRDTGASALIWGRVYGFGPKPLIELHISVSGNNMSHTYQLDDTQRLPTLSAVILSASSSSGGADAPRRSQP